MWIFMFQCFLIKLPLQLTWLIIYKIWLNKFNVSCRSHFLMVNGYLHNIYSIHIYIFNIIEKSHEITILLTLPQTQVTMSTSPVLHRLHRAVSQQVSQVRFQRDRIGTRIGTAAADGSVLLRVTCRKKSTAEHGAEVQHGIWRWT